MKVTSKAQALKILGLTSSATNEEIKKTYRQLSMKFHPDRVEESDKASAEVKFKEMKEAYEFLKANKPDEEGVEDVLRRWREKESTRKSSYSHDDVKFDYDAYRDFFNETEFEAIVTVTLEEAFAGCIKSLKLKLTGDNISVTIPPGYKPGEKVHIVAAKMPLTNKSITVVVKLAIDTRDSTVVWPEEMWLYGGAKEGSGNITKSIKINWLTIMSGGFEDVRTIDGKTIRIRVPAGTSTNTLLKAAGQGYWSDAKQSRRGDRKSVV